MTDWLYDTAPSWGAGTNGRLNGLAVGVVTDNQDPDGLARVRVRLPWLSEAETSYWARLAMPMAGKDHGTYFLPEVGDEVLVGAEDNDLSHLYVLGSLWNGPNPPPAKNDDGKDNTRLIRSRGHHELRFNDDGAKPEVELKLSDGKHVVLDKDGVTIEDGKGNTIKIDSTSGAVEITAQQKLSLKANTISIEATASLDVKATGTLTLKGALVQIN